MVPVTKAPRPRWNFGRKVALWLADQKAAGLEPASPTALARAVEVDQKTVVGWIEKGQEPRASTARRVALAMGADLEWLTDDAKPYPPPDASGALGILLKMIPAAEQDRLLVILRDPAERRAWLASWSARRGES